MMVNRLWNYTRDCVEMWHSSRWVLPKKLFCQKGVTFLSLFFVYLASYFFIFLLSTCFVSFYILTPSDIRIHIVKFSIEFSSSFSSFLVLCCWIFITIHIAVAYPNSANISQSNKKSLNIFHNLTRRPTGRYDILIFTIKNAFDFYWRVRVDILVSIFCERLVIKRTDGPALIVIFQYSCDKDA